MRNIDEHPYSKDEDRVAEWLVDKTGIGGGDDPIGFILVSHEYIAASNRRLRSALNIAWDYINSRADHFPSDENGKINDVLEKIAEALNESGHQVPPSKA